ncbi:hypothetical protein PR003_g9298 [Phytophthora rubi]|uniref:Uncharacterized protein n=1 Tax=Phytophthora rubi TaxID=129364 RepID=A0A6A4FSQ6_9STRA|nr:hypothetical protein PR001_g9239 [Phytophthora rubi]KAE9342780.1 hypothetical protein PR003_g9298 [Phytophthora rubi]
MERVTPVEDDLELAERSPEPSPESRPSPPMLPPFRHPQRPAAPPPPLLDAPIAVHTGPPRRSLGDSLPRRSLLAPEVTPPSPSGDEYARGRESDERKSEEEPESEKSKKRDRRPRKKRRSRILSELRPVDGPESALPSVPAINDDSSQASDDPLEAPDSGERAKEAFAAQRVRMRKSFRPDLRIYMKNAHPLFGICAAHRHHPYKRSDRSLVLLVALLVALLVCGLYAIRDCCSEVLNVPVAVVNRRLEADESSGRLSSAPYLLAPLGQPPRYLRGGRRRTTAAAASSALTSEGVQCLAFYADCSAHSAVCAAGSVCRKADNDGAGKCVPHDNPSQKCNVEGEFACSTGWTCSESTDLCVPASKYVCYLPNSGKTEENTAVELAGDPDETNTAIEAIFQILQIAATKHSPEMRLNPSASDDNTVQQSGSPTSSPSAASPSSTSTPRAAPPSTTATPSPSTSSSGSVLGSTTSSGLDSRSASSFSLASTSYKNSSSSFGSQSASSLSSSSSGSLSSESSMVKMTLTEPLNGAVYSLSSIILIQWHLSLLSGPDPGLDKFRVDFSADNGAFDTIASSVSASSSSGSSQDRNDTIFQYEWNLAENTSWMCTTCVLRICALDVNSVSSENLCIRSDGQTTSVESSRRLQATTVDGSGSSDVVTFRIVREALECSCGLAQESFLLAAVIIGVCIPVTVLLVEPLVTFYRDRQVFGLFARRDGPVRPVIAGYSTKSATHKGRVVLVLLLLALCVAFGFVAAQISTTNFLTEKGAVVVLWVVTFAIAVALGVLVYSTLVCFVIFGVRWWRERAYERREPSGLSEFQTSLLSDDEKISNDSITSPQ